MLMPDPRRDSSKETDNCRRRILDTNEMNTLCSSVDNRFVDGGAGVGEYSKSKKRNSSESAAEFPEKESKIRDYDPSSGDTGKKGVKHVGFLVVGGGEGNDGDMNGMTCVSHGSISVIGRRRAMEDAVRVAPGVAVGEFDVYDFFAVYDGHGGAMVANACRDRLHQLVAKEVKSIKEKFSEGKGIGFWEKVMRSCFEKMDDEVIAGVGGKGDEDGDLLSDKTVGSTAVVVMVGKEELVVANCGDSRAVLCRGGVSVPLSNDHKPDRPDERQRVEEAGGRIINWNGTRVLGVLGTSRSIGDKYLKPYVTSEPEVRMIKRTESDNFVVIGTDGLWDVISNEFACEVVNKCFSGEIKHRRFMDELNGSCAAEAAALLAELAMAKGSKDNISVIVVELMKSS